MQQRSDDGRIDATRQAEQHAVFTDLRADLLDVLGDDVLRGPDGLAPANVEHEAAEDRHPVLGVRDLGMELQPVNLAVDVGHGGERRIRRRADRRETFRQAFDAIAVAHPYLETRAEIREQRIAARQIHLGVAVLAMIGSRDRAAELRRERLHAVADAEHGCAGRNQRIADLRRALLAYRLGATRQDDALRRKRRDRFGGRIVRQDLAVNADLTDAPCDQLRVLPAEVDDENAFGVAGLLAFYTGVGGVRHYWER